MAVCMAMIETASASTTTWLSRASYLGHEFYIKARPCPAGQHQLRDIENYDEPGTGFFRCVVEGCSGEDYDDPDWPIFWTDFPPEVNAAYTAFLERWHSKHPHAESG